MDEKISLILGMIEQLQQKKSAPAPQPPPEPLVVPAVQQQPPPVLALQPTVMLTPLAIPTTAMSNPAPSNPEGMCAKPLHPPFGVNPGGKAPRAMADIRAYQRAHRDPTFSESESDEDERDEREANEHQRQITSTRPEAAPAPKQSRRSLSGSSNSLRTTHSVMGTQVQWTARWRHLGKIPSTHRRWILIVKRMRRRWS